MHEFQLGRIGIRDQFISFITADCAKKGWKIWGSHEPWLPWEPQTGMETEMPLQSPRVTIDAIAHCTDRTSGRLAVHVPDIPHNLRRQDAMYRKAKADGTLNTAMQASWEALLQHLKMNEREQLKLVIYKSGD